MQNSAVQKWQESEKTRILRRGNLFPKVIGNFMPFFQNVNQKKSRNFPKKDLPILKNFLKLEEEKHLKKKIEKRLFKFQKVVKKFQKIMKVLK